jgi:hypothetical protein
MSPDPSRPPRAPDPKTERGVRSHRPAPYEGAVTQVIAKIQGEPFLFVIAVAALLVGLAVLAAGLGSPTLRLTMTLIGVLAFVVIVGYYLLEGVRITRRRPEPTAADPSSSAPPARQVSGKVKVDELSGEAQLKGVRASSGALPDQASVSGEVEAGKAGDRARAIGVEIGEDSTERPRPKPRG